MSISSTGRSDIEFGGSFTISEFCQRNKISRGYYYTLKKIGRGPDEMSPDGKLKRITARAEAAWQKAGEAIAAAAKPETNIPGHTSTTS
jgi:hypothetical protein